MNKILESVILNINKQAFQHRKEIAGSRLCVRLSVGILNTCIDNCLDLKDKGKYIAWRIELEHLLANGVLDTKDLICINNTGLKSLLQEALKLDFVERKYWENVNVTSGVPAALCKDGQLYMIENNYENEQVLTKKFPTKKYKGRSRVWYFNESLDRECAEVNGDRITINPSAFVDVFGTIIHEKD